jgi:hypothetical protein
MPETGRSDTLFDLGSTRYPAGSTEDRIRKALDSLNAERTFTDGEAALAEVARALAENIDAGNRKGRAIANEAMQLVAIMQLIRPADVATVDPTGIPAETQSFMDALNAPPAA